MPPTNYYKLKFEGQTKSLRGSVPTTNKFDYRQIGGGRQLCKEDGTVEEMPDPKVPQSGQFYVAIYDSQANSIRKLLETNENDVSSF